MDGASCSSLATSPRPLWSPRHPMIFRSRAGAGSWGRSRPLHSSSKPLCVETRIVPDSPGAMPAAARPIPPACSQRGGPEADPLEATASPRARSLLSIAFSTSVISCPRSCIARSAMVLLTTGSCSSWISLTRKDRRGFARHADRVAFFRFLRSRFSFARRGIADAPEVQRLLRRERAPAEYINGISGKTFDTRNAGRNST